jgi:phosphopantetheine adenylyltransferase
LFNLSTTQALGLIRTHFELIETAINTSTDGLYIILDPYPLNQSDLENFQWGDEEVKALLYVMGFYQEVVKLCDMGLSSELIFNSMIKYPSSTLKEFVVDGLQSENDPKLSNITFDTLSSNVDFEILLQNISHNIIIIPPRTNYQIYIIPNIVNFALPYELIHETRHINEPNINLQLSQITQITHQMLDFPISRAICHILRTFKSLSPLGTQHGNINPLPINIITHSIDFPFSKNNININTMNPNNHPNNLSKWQLHYSTDPLLNILASLGLFEITTQITHFKQTILLIVDCMTIHNFIHNIVINNAPSLPPFYININPQLKQQCQLTPLNKTISITSYGTVCIGGTFDHLHIGHLALLTSAMLLGKDGLILGITSPEMLEKKTLAELIEPWDTRVQQVLSYCQIFKGSCGDNMNQNGCVSDQTKRYNSPNTPKNSNLTIHSLKPPLCLNETTNPHFEIAYKSTIVHSYNSNTNLQTQNNHVFRIIVEPLFDMYGPSTKYHEITCLILSKEVQKGGPMVNIERKRLDRPMCDLFIVPLVNLPLAETVLIEDLGIQSNHKSKHEQSNHYPNPPIEQINSFNTTPHCIKYIPTNNPQLKVSSTDFRMFYKTIQLESKQ